LKSAVKQQDKLNKNGNIMHFKKKLKIDKSLAVGSVAHYLNFWQVWHHNWDDQDIALIHESFDLKGKSVLEIGCGDGRVAFGLKSFCAQLTAIDFDEKLLKLARQRLVEQFVANLHFLLMDAEDLNFADETFDFIVMPWVLQMVADPQLAAAQAHRVLKKGGELLVIGLRSDADYDQIISQFVPKMIQIEPEKNYALPLKLAFGEEPSESISTFYYFFESAAIAFDAFAFAIKHWYQTELSSEDETKLVEILKQYSDDERTKLAFPASVYKVRKT
jgi:ubiquinone/menaquinone biosynthesis C-methylase UbiE